MLAANTKQQIKHETQSTNSAQSCGAEIHPALLSEGKLFLMYCVVSDYFEKTLF